MARNRVKGITIVIDGDTQDLQKALKKVDGAIHSTEKNVRSLDRALKLDPGNTNLLVQKQEEFQRAIKNTEERLDTLKEAYHQALETEGTKPETLSILQQEIGETEANLKGLKNEMKDFGSVAEQQARLAGEAFKNAGSKITEAGEGLKNTGKNLTTKVTAPIVGIGAAVLKETADFDQAMAEVQALSGASAEDFDMLREKALEMSKTTKFSADEVAEAFKYMALAGWEPTKMMEGIAGILNATTVSGGELGSISDIITDGLSAFQMGADEADRFSDVLAKTSASANTDINQMGEAFKYAGALAGTFGFEIEDVGIALGLMANQSVKGSQAGTALRGSLARLAKPSAEVLEYLSKLSLVNGEYANSIDTEKLDKQAKKVQDAEEKLARIEEEMERAMTSSDDKTNEKLEKINKQIIEEQEKLSKAQADYDDALAKGLKRTKFENQIESAQKKIADLQAQYEEVSANAGVDNSEKMIKLQQRQEDAIKNLQSAQEEYDKVAAGSEEYLVKGNLLLTDQEGNMRSLKDMMILLREEFAGLTEAEQAEYAAALFGQRGMTGMLAIINSSDEDFNKLINNVENSTGAAQEMADVMNDNLGAQFKILMNNLQALAISFGDIMMPVAMAVVDKLKEFVQWLDNLDEGTKETIIQIAAMAAVVGPLLVVLGTVVGAVGKIVSVIGTVISVGGKLFTLISAISSLGLGPMVAIIGAVVAAGYLLIKNWDKIKEAAAKVWGFITDKINGAIEAVKNFFGLSDKAESKGSKATNNSGVNWYAKAENKPYYFNSPQVIGVGDVPEVVIGANKFNQLQQAAQGMTNNITVNATVNNDQDINMLADKIASSIQRSVNRRNLAWG